jgi:hypothetical protein
VNVAAPDAGCNEALSDQPSGVSDGTLLDGAGAEIAARLDGLDTERKRAADAAEEGS